MAYEVRTQATRMAVDLLRGSMANVSLANVLSAESEDGFEDLSNLFADRLGRVVEKVAVRIENQIR